MKYKIRKYFRKLFYLVMFFTCLSSVALADQTSGRDDVVITSEPTFYMNCNGTQYSLSEADSDFTAHMDDGSSFDYVGGDFYYCWPNSSSCSTCCKRVFSVTESVDTDTFSHTIRILNNIETYLMAGWSGMNGSSMDMENSAKWNVNMLGQYLISITSAHGGYYTINVPVNSAYVEDVPLYYRITLDDGTVVIDQTLYLSNLVDDTQQFYVEPGQTFTININMTNRQTICWFVEGTRVTSYFDIYGDSSIALPTPTPATLNDIISNMDFTDQNNTDISNSNNSISNTVVSYDDSNLNEALETDQDMEDIFDNYLDQASDSSADITARAFNITSILTPLTNLSTMFDTWFSHLDDIQILIWLSFLFVIIEAILVRRSKDDD